MPIENKLQIGILDLERDEINVKVKQERRSATLARPRRIHCSRGIGSDHIIT